MWEARVSTKQLHVARPQQPRPAPDSDVLREFCDGGIKPSGHKKEADLLVKELLAYRLLDICAYLNRNGAQWVIKEKSTIPFVEKMVRCVTHRMEPSTKCRLIQGHSTMADWHNLVSQAAFAMEHHGSPDTPPTHQGTDAGDTQLIRCFHNLCLASGSAYKSKVMQNFSAAAFHLCFILQVSQLLLDRLQLIHAA
jgi:hypothetical protein